MPGRYLLPSLVLALTATPMAAQAQISDTTAIRAELDSTAAGWNRNDLARYMAAYDDSMTSMGRSGLVHGKAATEAGVKAAFWKDDRSEQHLHYEHVVVQMLGTGYALCTGEYVLSGGGKPDRTGWFSTIWVRTKAGWRMIHDHS